MPAITALPDSRQSTPEIGLCTISVVSALADDFGIRVETRIALNAHSQPIRLGALAIVPGESGAFLLSTD